MRHGFAAVGWDQTKPHPNWCFEKQCANVEELHLLCRWMRATWHDHHCIHFLAYGWDVNLLGVPVLMGYVEFGADKAHTLDS